MAVAAGLGAVAGIFIGQLFGSGTTNALNQTINISNEYMQVSTSKCSTACTNAITGNTIIIDGVSIGGNFEINQSCSVNSGCSFSNNIQTSITNVIKAQGNQQNKVTTGLLGFSLASATNDVNFNAQVNNVTQQILQTECQVSATNIFSNNLFYFTDAQVGGNVVLNQSNSPANQCVVNNLAKISAFTGVTSNFSQSNTIRNGLVFIIICIVILVIILVGGAVLILLAFGGLSLFSGSKSSTTGTTTAAPASGGGNASKLAALAPLAIAL